METKRIINSILADASAVSDGEQDALRVYVAFKSIENALTCAFERISNDVLSECDRYEPRELAERGVTVRNGTSRWHYEDCPEWVLINNQKKALEEELKARAKVTEEIVDNETGEVLAKPYRTISARSVIVDKRFLESF